MDHFFEAVFGQPSNSLQ